jgi:hypothetical protein
MAVYLGLGLLLGICCGMGIGFALPQDKEEGRIGFIVLMLGLIFIASLVMPSLK